ncbi:MAG: oligopeptide ABC transporter ATP-binding protein, partial [Clostridiales bacterium]|nr:oligopeptide ABC transporter ATP-binding protein [Clostridiales bacterium]
LGTIVESGPTKDVINNPLHPYTKALLSAVPRNPLQESENQIRLAGNIPSTVNIPSGCRLHPRCPYATAECEHYEAKLEQVEPGREVACLYLKKD